MSSAEILVTGLWHDWRAAQHVQNMSERLRGKLVVIAIKRRRCACCMSLGCPETVSFFDKQ